MGFQILNNDKKPINIYELDKEACQLWGQEYDKKWYARPYVRDTYPDDSQGYAWYCMQSNWFDQIGYIIHRYNCNTWTAVRRELINGLEKYDALMQYLIRDKYLQLVEHWEAKGYMPRPVKD